MFVLSIIFELNEDDTYSHPVTFDLQSLFKSIGTISTSVEMTLGANLPYANMKRLDWVTGDEHLSQMDVPSKNFNNKSFLIEVIYSFLEEKSLKDTSVHFESNANSNIPSDNRINDQLK